MRKLQRSQIILVLCFAMMIGIFLGFKFTESGTYQLVSYANGTTQIQDTYHHFWLAKNALAASNDRNLCIMDEQGNVLALKEGLVNLHTKAITENTSYTIDGTDEKGYINGQYGADALYLGTNHDGSKILCMISGVRAWFNRSDVVLYPYSDQVHSSYYTIQGNALNHTISLSVTDTQSVTYAIGPKPEGLQENTVYFSYDGHWFYDSFDKLSDDMQLERHDHAVNSTAYYNPYQFMPHRSTTSLSAEDFNTFLENKHRTNSLLYDQGETILKGQNTYGINAAMVFSLACNESAYGQSAIAKSTNNLFGHAAYDSNPDAATSYASIANCIQAHDVDFIQKGYANPKDSRYRGSWFGDKSTGINVNYASDPYWGEKAASIYYQLEPNLKQKPSTWMCTQDIPVYDKPNGNVLYTYTKGSVISVIIKKQENGWTQIASEAPIKNGAIDVKGTYNNDSVYIEGD